MESRTGRTDITAILSLSIQKHINPHDDTRIYWAKEVESLRSQNEQLKNEIGTYEKTFLGLYRKRG